MAWWRTWPSSTESVTTDKIDKSLRHTQAHYVATQRYHQLAYQWNRNEHVPAVAHLKSAMPVRLDQRVKLAVKAEW